MALVIDLVDPVLSHAGWCSLILFDKHRVVFPTYSTAQQQKKEYISIDWSRTGTLSLSLNVRSGEVVNQLRSFAAGNVRFKP